MSIFHFIIPLYSTYYNAKFSFYQSSVQHVLQCLFSILSFLCTARTKMPSFHFISPLYSTYYNVNFPFYHSSVQHVLHCQFFILSVLCTARTATSIFHFISPLYSTYCNTNFSQPTLNPHTKLPATSQVMLQLLSLPHLLPHFLQNVADFSSCYSSSKNEMCIYLIQ